jgi:cobalt-zinc-cadmium efflux system outer membrane protein
MQPHYLPAMRLHSLFVLVPLLAAPLVLHAQGEGEGALTVAGAIALARAHNPLLAAASGHRQAAEARVRQEAAFPNPTLEWRRENLDSPLARDQFTTLALPIDLTGRRLALRGAARAAGARGTADSATVARQVEVEAARAYWRAALAHELLASAAEQREATEQLATFDADRARTGAVAEVSAMRTRLEAERARLAEVAAGAEWRRAVADLARATGVPAEQLPPLAPVRFTLDSHAPVPGTASALALAVAHRSELAAKRAAVDEARQRVAAEGRGIISDVVIEAGLKQTSGYTTKLIGVGVPLPLFNSNGAGRSRAQGELRAAEAELRAAEQAVRADAVAAVESYRTLLAASAGAGDTITARSGEIARIAAAAYREGGTSLLEVLEAQRARAEARAAATRWIIDVRLARLELDRATGAPLTDSLENP